MKNIILYLVIVPLISFAQTNESENTSNIPQPETRAPISELEERPSVSNWGFTGEAWAETYSNHVKREDWLNILLIRPYYKLTDSSTFAVGQELMHSIGGNEEKAGGSFTVLDTHIEYAHSKIAEFGGFTLKGYLRPYLGTSEASQNPISGRYGLVRGQLSATTPLDGHFTVGYWVEPRYFFYKNKTYETSDGDLVHNENARVKHWLGVTANYDEGFSGYQFVGINHRYYHDDRPQLDALYWETALGWNVNQNLVVYLGAYSETTHNIRRNDFVFFDENEFLYFIDGIVNF